MKRITAFFLAVVLSLSLCTQTVIACNEEQTDTYIPQILFGDEAFSRSSDEHVIMLLDALYLCSEQADNQGQDKIDYLKSKKVFGVPTLSKLNISGGSLLECSHNAWEYEYAEYKDVQVNRRKVLQNTVNKVFDFGLLGNLFGSKDGKCNSFAALLYYSHILADYLADDPANTEAYLNGKSIPAYSGQPYVKLNEDQPSFTSEQKQQTNSYAEYSPLDSLGRAGVAMGNIGLDIMPDSGTRPNIGMIKPSGWNQEKYKEIIGIEDTPGYIFERCHLIAHQLAGNSEETNLITGTDYLNNKGMKDIEDKVVDYIRKTGNHVLYRVTPIYKKDNLVASGVQIEAYSVEDNGQGICINRYCYNVQPGFDINYMNGSNHQLDTLFQKENCLPFCVQNASDANPDLPYEIEKHLRILFVDQKTSSTYQSMMVNIKVIADDARNLGMVKNRSKTQYYVNLKQIQYKYFDALKSYVPLLLEKESFFQSAFN